ncbi:hypothetical protein HY638_00730, partial [Candidatus Woesearchaeota archaeon]|nr:hypothetical protein [Candidatus Woesearchaeota archaeon]
MSLIDIGKYQPNSSRPVYMNLTDWSKNPKAAEKMLESALRKGDTINYDTAIWANVD